MEVQASSTFQSGKSFKTPFVSRVKTRTCETPYPYWLSHGSPIRRVEGSWRIENEKVEKTFVSKGQQKRGHSQLTLQPVENAEEGLREKYVDWNCLIVQGICLSLLAHLARQQKGPQNLNVIAQFSLRTFSSSTKRLRRLIVQSFQQVTVYENEQTAFFQESHSLFSGPISTYDFEGLFSTRYKNEIEKRPLFLGVSRVFSTIGNYVNTFYQQNCEVTFSD